MQITITGRHMGVTEAMKAYARSKVEKLLRFAGRAPAAVIRMDVAHGEHEVEIVIEGARGPALVGHASAPDMYAAVDLAEQKLAMRLRRAKERREDHHRGDRRRDAGSVAPSEAGRDASGTASADENQTYEDVIERLRRGE